MPEKTPDKPLADRRLWEIAVVRDVFGLLIVALVVVLMFQLAAILIPIIVAFALAYVVNPVVTHVARNWRWPRWVAVIALLFVIAAVGAGLGTYLIPQFVDQLERLLAALPRYVEALQDDLGVDLSGIQAQLKERLTEPEDPGETAQGVLRSVGRVLGFLGVVISTATYIFVAMVLIAALFIFFSAKFDRLGVVQRYVPVSRREQVSDVLGRIDVALSAFIRGQLVVAIFTTTGFCIGFWLADVPYWFVISLIGGAFSLVPYGQMSGWILALAAKYLEWQTGDTGEFSWFAIVIAPSLVYAVTQSLESFIVTPFVQGEANNMPPLVILLVIVVGGALGGFLGVLLAIPAASTARILFDEFARPRLERWVLEH